MATVTMTNGHRYKFAASAGTPVLIESSDNVGDVNYFHNAVHMEDIEYSAGSTGFLTIKGNNGNTGYGPQILCWNVGSGDAGICFRTDSVYWHVGQDNNQSNRFSIGNSYAIGSSVALTIDTSEDVTIHQDLSVDGMTYLDGIDCDGNVNINGDMTFEQDHDIEINSHDSGQIRILNVASSTNRDAMKIGIDGEYRGYFKFYDDDDETDQRCYIGYDASTNEFVIQQYKSDTNTWPAYKFPQSGTAVFAGTTVTSDQRLKDNIQTITGSLDIIKKLRGVSYNWNASSSFDAGKKDFGLIAQEVELVLPEIVDTSPDTEANADVTSEGEKIKPLVDNMKSMQYGHLAGHFVEAIKEQQVIIEDLKARIIALENA